MTYAIGSYDDFIPAGRLRSSRKRSVQLLPALVGLVGSVLVAALILDVEPALAPGAARIGSHLEKLAIAPVVLAPDAAMVLAFSGAPLGQAEPVQSEWVAAEAPAPIPTDTVAVAEAAPVEPAAPLPPLRPASEALDLPDASNTSPLVADIPMPVRRPSDLYERPAPGPVRLPSRVAANHAPAAADNPAPDARSVFDKLFGIGAKPTGPALAYAAPEDGVMSHLFGSGAPSANPDQQTAVYDISAHTVYLPNGTALEAHSGLGSLLDDPRSIAAKNRGVTPPSLYDLTLREKLFHGVRALRLTPVGNNRVFGRVGLLAHTFMLGPNGDSNGCVSFRNYNAFLQAFLNGNIRRLQVVTHRV